MGGCQSCRVTDLQGQWNLNIFNNKQQLQSTGLLTYREKIAWEENVLILGIPVETFWADNCQYKHTCFKQIRKDIMRTFPQSAFFGDKHNLDRFQMLLQKFALHFPRIGYTQGINFLAGYLLISGFDDNSAFNLLVRVCVHQKILALGLYQDEFPLIRFYCQLFWKLLWKKLPKIAEKISRAKLADQIWIFQWFISFFLYSFPLETMKSFWNFILLKKQFSLVLLALGIIKSLKKDIMAFQQDDQIQYYQYFETLKEYDVFRTKVQMKKVLNFTSGVTKLQIQQAIRETTCINNPYRKYFQTKDLLQQKQMWVGMVKNLQLDRKSFRMNPNSSLYRRNRQQAENIDIIFMSKINKLYHSDVRKPRNKFKNSTFSLIKDLSIVHSLPQHGNFGRKTESIIFHEPENTRQQKPKGFNYLSSSS